MAGKPPDPPNPPDGVPGRPGAVVHDASGKAVWKWSSESDSTSRLLKQLEVPGLAIEDEPKPKVDEKAAAQQSPRPAAGGGFNPYGDAAGSRPASVTKPPVAPQPVRRRGWFSRLFGGKD